MPDTKRKPSQEDVESVEAIVGMGRVAWDMVPAEDIISASFTVMGGDTLLDACKKLVAALSKHVGTCNCDVCEEAGNVLADAIAKAGGRQ